MVTWRQLDAIPTQCQRVKWRIHHTSISTMPTDIEHTDTTPAPNTMSANKSTNEYTTPARPVKQQMCCTSTNANEWNNEHAVSAQCQWLRQHTNTTPAQCQIHQQTGQHRHTAPAQIWWWTHLHHHPVPSTTTNGPMPVPDTQPVGTPTRTWTWMSQVMNQCEWVEQRACCASTNADKSNDKHATSQMTNMPQVKHERATPVPAQCVDYHNKLCQLQPTPANTSQSHHWQYCSLMKCGHIFPKNH